MEYSDVLKHLSPCGLDCVRCADYEQGEIKQLSSRLIQLLGNYKPVAKMKTEKQPIFNDYPQFNEILKSFANGICSGCRGENVQCPITTCAAKTCHKDKSVDFCFQCAEYPCDKQFTGRLRDRWRYINDRMKEIGVVEYYYEQVKLPRY
ncbi:hypothetical protein SPSYN_02956 [Sporotomaculum syntrophicum]|uniref:DUF3795 domain-containing protein n=1 Tax=Sporotomaculum syntrophicum TaxID=182264 RepID=A0A9D3AXS7_9FIRM|nr:DUF3795 domain-containing protein [Sporotomaculum syntrophicum]KAF1084044.1 hypothetical protein SPSYN_02956 [Sporotomaculum syntrophicum]